MVKKGLIEELYNEITPESKEFIEKNKLEEVLFSEEMCMVIRAAVLICEQIEIGQKIHEYNFNLHDLVAQIMAKKISWYLTNKKIIHPIFTTEDFKAKQLYQDLAKIVILYTYQYSDLIEKEKNTGIDIYV